MHNKEEKNSMLQIENQQILNFTLWAVLCMIVSKLVSKSFYQFSYSNQHTMVVKNKNYRSIHLIESVKYF